VLRPDAGRRRRCGGSLLLETAFGAAVFALVVTGTVGLYLLVQSHNLGSDHTRQATKGCQEILEQLLAMNFATMSAQNGVPFVVPPLHPTQALGSIQITDVSPPGDPGTILEVVVRVQASGVVDPPVNVALTTWRANK